jgi:hypothetical protein
MPEYTFDGPYPVTPAARDARNIPLGEVQPGDIRDLDEPLDGNWRPATDEDRAALASREAGRSEPAKTGSGGSSDDEGTGDDSAGDSGQAGAPQDAAGASGPGAPAAGPVPAPPAVVPGA